MKNIKLPEGVTYVRPHKKGGKWIEGHFAKRGRKPLGNKKVTFKLPPVVVERLAAASEATGFNKSQICGQALMHWLSNQPVENK